VSSEDATCRTETCRFKLETIKVIYTFISAFVGITYVTKKFCFSCGQRIAVVISMWEMALEVLEI
jgi:hypothetical protein